MRIGHLFNHHNRAPARIEPRRLNAADSWAPSRPLAGESLGEPIVDDEYAKGPGVQECLHGSGAVFGLIGTPASIDDARASHTPDGIASDADDLLKVLYGQYCRALDDPKASLAGDWIAQATPAGDHGADLTSLIDYAHQPASSFDSIETFLSGAYKMEHAFGPIGTGEAPELTAMEPVPEILRLFAPPEYAASALRRPSALPPELARREHHALGIDSPLSMPHSTSFHSDAS